MSEATRLEALWSGPFGDAYTERNATVFEDRTPFWRHRLADMPANRVLEVGCNFGANLAAICETVPAQYVYGVDVNTAALRAMRRDLPGVNGLWGHARDLPFRDGYFDLVFTMGVLIHQPDATLPRVMTEMVRCSSRWVLCAEYSGEGEVPYRGVARSLFRRDYGGLFAEMFPELTLIDHGEAGPEEIGDDLTWWTFEKVGS